MMNVGAAELHTIYCVSCKEGTACGLGNDQHAARNDARSTRPTSVPRSPFLTFYLYTFHISPRLF
jgi:hypothetical protein